MSILSPIGRLADRFLRLAMVLLGRSHELTASISYSQEAEDIILNHIFSRQNQGFYIDVGAHDPYLYSTTFLLYRRGWRGINIDPREGMKESFDRERPGDINLEMAISDQKGEKTFYVFDQPGVSTFDPDSMKRNLENGFKLLKEKKVTTDTLANVINQHGAHRRIDYLNLDAEGEEKRILESIDWENNRPVVISIEIILPEKNEKPDRLFKHGDKQYWCDIDRAQSNPIHQMLVEKGYGMFAKGIATFFYVDKRQTLL